MKNIKVLSMITLGCGALLLTGCGGNSHTLTCEKEFEDGQHEILDLKYNDDETKLEEIEATMEIEISEGTSDEEIEQAKSMYESMLCNGEGYKCSVDEKGGKLVVTLSGGVDELSSLEIVADIEEGKTLEELKKEAEEEGYTCK